MKIEAQIDFVLIRCWITADLCGVLCGFVFAIFLWLNLQIELYGTCSCENSPEFWWMDLGKVGLLVKNTIGNRGRFVVRASVARNWWSTLLKEMATHNKNVNCHPRWVGQLTFLVMNCDLWRNRNLLAEITDAEPESCVMLTASVLAAFDHRFVWAYLFSADSVQLLTLSATIPVACGRMFVSLWGRMFMRVLWTCTPCFHGSVISSSHDFRLSGSGASLPVCCCAFVIPSLTICILMSVFGRGGRGAITTFSPAAESRWIRCSGSGAGDIVWGSGGCRR